jgi:hypothetical protein
MWSVDVYMCTLRPQPAADTTHKKATFNFQVHNSLFGRRNVAIFETFAANVFLSGLSTFEDKQAVTSFRVARFFEIQFTKTVENMYTK